MWNGNKLLPLSVFQNYETKNVRMKTVMKYRNNKTNADGRWSMWETPWQPLHGPIQSKVLTTVENGSAGRLNVVALGC